MCSNSVAPIPSINLFPVASNQARQVASGKCSPAETHRRRDETSLPSSCVSIARYAVGAVKRTEILYSEIFSNKTGGAAFSNKTVVAPMRSGNTTRPPRPNVKAIGGLPANTSSFVGLTTPLEKVSAIAKISR